MKNIMIKRIDDSEHQIANLMYERRIEKSKNVDLILENEDLLFSLEKEMWINSIRTAVISRDLVNFYLQNTLYKDLINLIVGYISPSGNKDFWEKNSEHILECITYDEVQLIKKFDFQ